jgi:hypothetical protein
MSEFRLIGWGKGLGYHLEWSRNSPGYTPNTYERCRELAHMWNEQFSLFEIHEKKHGRWELYELFGEYEQGSS